MRIHHGLIGIGAVILSVLLRFPEGNSAAGEELSGQKDIPNIIIITLSGVRNSESIADPEHQYIPHLSQELFREGVLYTRLIDANCEFHMPSVDSINTGKDYLEFWGAAKSPTIFQYIRKKYSLPKTKLWSIGHWIYDGCIYKTPDFPENTYPCQIAPLNYATTPKQLKTSPELEEILNKQGLSFLRLFNEQTMINRHLHYWDSLGEVMQDFFKKIVEKFQPNFIHYVMGGPESGHYDSFSRYALSVKQCDEFIFQIWKMVRTDPFYKDRTFLIVSPDHNRDLYYMQHTENTSDNPSNVWMYIYGPGVKKGISIDRAVSHKDIFATVDYIMRSGAGPADGEILKDCFLKQ